MGGIAAQLVFAVASFANPNHIATVVQSKVPFGVQTALSEIGILVMVVSGIGMLKGANWARFIYIVWASLALVRAVTLFQVTPQQLMILIVGCAKYAACIYFLMRADANRYFQATAQRLSKFRIWA